MMTMSSLALRFPGYGRVMVLATMLALVMMAEEPRCSLPDPKGPDGWRMTPVVQTGTR